MKERKIICKPQDCVVLLLKYGRMKQEHFGVIFLNSQREVIQSKCFFVGSDNICSVYPKLVFWKACTLRASSMILFHNHPSGNPEPSEYDIKLTDSFVKGGELLGIQVLDHVIVSKYRYHSFLENKQISQDMPKTKVAEL